MADLWNGVKQEIYVSKYCSELIILRGNNLCVIGIFGVESNFIIFLQGPIFFGL
jgi:hypothetical protein